MQHIDIIVPVKDEAENLISLVKRTDAAFKKSKWLYRMIIVDDYSTDESWSLLQSLSTRYPVLPLKKKGEPGKAFSLLEGASAATNQWLAIIDGDLQYPPEALPAMLEKTKQYEVVVARRRSRHEPVLRQVASKTFSFVFGRMLFGFKCDVQSGMKVFKKEVIDHLDKKAVTAWTIDLPLLYTAQELGHQIGEYDIEFAKRQGGKSKIKLLRSIWEIGSQSLLFKVRHKPPLILRPRAHYSMIGAGMVQKSVRFITHSTLPNYFSAFTTFTRWQRTILGLMVGIVTGFLIAAPLSTLTVLVAGLSFLYFVDIFFNLVVISNSLHQSPEISFTDEEIDQVDDEQLPVYSILCPLYREGAVLPQFVESIHKLDWPKDKLDVMLLLEDDDKETVSVAEAMNLPEYFRIVRVPHSLPKTKPKACNYGLAQARGEYVVIYDAEDVPEPNQLKKAYLGFHKLPSTIACLQAKLNYFNPFQNVLTRLFTVEYSLWFNVTLPGLQTFNTLIPLGGTSNHFRTETLHQLKGWDPFNVTEDCDLGVRLFKHGYQTAIIDSVTLEEANSSLPNWLRQRSRWIKGYMQTFLVHMRHPLHFFREYGVHALFFQLVIGGKLLFMMINPIMWLLTISYFALYSVVGSTIEQLYPGPVFAMALTSLVIGNFLSLYCYMIGAAKRGQWQLIKYVYLQPFYWLGISVAAVMAGYQLLVKPHYWEKTIHGLHLSRKQREQAMAEREPQPTFVPVT